MIAGAIVAVLAVILVADVVHSVVVGDWWRATVTAATLVWLTLSVDDRNDLV